MEGVLLMPRGASTSCSSAGRSTCGGTSRYMSPPGECASLEGRGHRPRRPPRGTTLLGASAAAEPPSRGRCSRVYPGRATQPALPAAQGDLRRARYHRARTVPGSLKAGRRGVLVSVDAVQSPESYPPWPQWAGDREPCASCRCPRRVAAAGLGAPRGVAPRGRRLARRRPGGTRHGQGGRWRRHRGGAGGGCPRTRPASPTGVVGPWCHEPSQGARGGARAGRARAAAGGAGRPGTVLSGGAVWCAPGRGPILARTMPQPVWRVAWRSGSRAGNDPVSRDVDASHAPGHVCGRQEDVSEEGRDEEDCREEDAGEEGASQKPAARKAPARKPATAKKTSAKKPVTKKAPVKKAARRRPPPRSRWWPRSR